MIGLSFNARGVRGAPKVITLKISFQAYKLDFIMIQERMCSGEKYSKVFQNFLSDWSFYTIDSLSLSGGLLSAWSPRFKAYFSFVLPSRIVVNIEDQNLNSSIKLINMYGPYA
jgi:hypothetical protein